MKHIVALIALYCLCALFNACNLPKDKLEKALRQAHENRGELEKVLQHYKNDSLKYKAACYLIENMPYHTFAEERIVSPEGKAIELDITRFPNSNVVEKYCDSLFRYGYNVERVSKNDVRAISSAFLIENIDLAFEVWQKPWARQVSFDNFCAFILPYRAQSEIPSTLRREIMQRYLPLLEDSNVQTSFEACKIINNRLKTEIKYKDTGSPLYPTIEETYRAGISRCDGLCNLGAFVMRAVGIPIAVDMTLWAKLDLGHSWCAVLDGSQFHGFGPGEVNPGEQKSNYTRGRSIPAKVYRIMFAPEQRGNIKNDDRFPSFLKNALFYDVTTQYYIPPATLRVQATKEFKRSEGIVYLCVYNRDRWQPLALGTRTGNNCVFDNVVGDNIFIAADSPDGKNLRFVTPPFYMDRQGKVVPFIPDFSNLQSITLNKRKRKIYQPHTLNYWDAENEKFRSLPFKSATDSTQTYNNVPKGAMLLFSIPEPIINQRISCIRNDSLWVY